MPENSSISFSEARAFIRSADNDGDWVEALKFSDNVRLERLCGESPEWDFSKSDADLCFTADFSIDKRSRREIRKMMKRKPLMIHYEKLSLFPRIKLWCIVHWAKLFHKPFCISTSSNKLIVCKDINELL